MFLSDLQWQLLQPILTTSTSRGRPTLDNRLILEVIFWKINFHQPWYDIPSTSPSWQTCYQRYHRWQRTGIWKSILHTLILDLHDRGGFDLIHLWEAGELTLKRGSSCQIELVGPPEFADTWQLSTAHLILCAFANEHP
jgi:transposase